jgi:hypothetical protein
MTVKELISELEQLDPTQKIYMIYPDDHDEVEVVRIEPSRRHEAGYVLDWYVPGQYEVYFSRKA